MRGKWFAFAGVVCVSAAALLVPRAHSQEKSPAAPSAQPDARQMAAMMAKMQAAMTPGPMHKRLEHFAGKWDLTTKIWMNGPGTEPTVTKGTQESRMILGGRYLQDEMKGEMQMPGPDGKPMNTEFQGTGVTGYDNFRKMYVATWADSMSTQLMVMRGNCDPEGKVLTMYGEMDEPMLDTVGRMIKTVTRIIDDNTHVFEMYDLHAGDNYKVMEITYKRK